MECVITSNSYNLFSKIPKLIHDSALMETKQCWKQKNYWLWWKRMTFVSLQCEEQEASSTEMWLNKHTVNITFLYRLKKNQIYLLEVKNSIQSLFTFTLYFGVFCKFKFQFVWHELLPNLMRLWIILEHKLSTQPTILLHEKIEVHKSLIKFLPFLLSQFLAFLNLLVKFFVFLVDILWSLVWVWESAKIYKFSEKKEGKSFLKRKSFTWFSTALTNVFSTYEKDFTFYRRGLFKRQCNKMLLKMNNTKSLSKSYLFLFC
jgi:hypothetical protein